MNRKYIGAGILAAAMFLSGCTGGADNSENLSAEQSTQSFQSTQSSQSSRSTSAYDLNNSAQSPVSSQGGISDVITSGFQSSISAVSVPEASTPETSGEASSLETSTGSSAVEIPEASSSEVLSDTSTPEKPTQSHPVESDFVGADEIRTVSAGKTLYIESGKMLTVEGTLIVESGAALNVAKDGELFVNGIVKLDGDLVLFGDGKLSMGSDSARIDGSGSVAVMYSFEQIDCEHGTIKAHITPPERVVENGVTTVGGVVIANKAISLPPEYGSHLSLNEVEPEVYAAVQEMSSAANHKYVNRSGYRSYWYQKTTFQNNCDLFGFERADMLSSRAGHSEHQTGLTMDLDSFDQNYGATPEGKWLAENCWKYGFIIRYPKGKEHITGYDYEPWHIRYLGKSTAKLVFDSGLTLEEFLNVEGGTTVID